MMVDTVHSTRGMFSIRKLQETGPLRYKTKVRLVSFPKSSVKRRLKSQGRMGVCTFTLPFVRKKVFHEKLSSDTLKSEPQILYGTFLRDYFYEQKEVHSVSLDQLET